MAWSIIELRFVEATMTETGNESLHGESEAARAEENARLKWTEILFGVFSDPVSLFKRLSEKPQWASAMIVLVISATLLPILDRSAEMGAKFVGVGAILGSLLGMSSMLFIAGLIWWGIGYISADDPQWRPTYRHGLVVAVVTKLVMVPHFLLGFLWAFLQPVGIRGPEQIIPTSLGYWLQTDSPNMSVLYRQLDLFQLATFALLFLEARYTMRSKLWGAALCLALSVAASLQNSIGRWNGIGL